MWLLEYLADNYARSLLDQVDGFKSFDIVTNKGNGVIFNKMDLGHGFYFVEDENWTKD